MQGFIGIDAFFEKYQLGHCQTAKQRVKEQKGGYAGEETKASLAVRVLDITQRMINASDLLQLEYYDVEQILPAIIDIQSSLNNYPNLDKSAPYVVKIDKWVQLLQ